MLCRESSCFKTIDFFSQSVETFFYISYGADPDPYSEYGSTKLLDPDPHHWSDYALGGTRPCSTCSWGSLRPRSRSTTTGSDPWLSKVCTTLYKLIGRRLNRDSRDRQVNFINHFYFKRKKIFCVFHTQNVFLPAIFLITFHCQTFLSKFNDILWYWYLQ